MRLITKAAVAASSIALLAAAPATAGTNTMSGAYQQGTSSLECEGHVNDDGDGGTMYVEVAGAETRPSDKHFRTARIVTRLYAQEKTYNGTWKTVEVSAKAHGNLARAINSPSGAYNLARFSWGGNISPELAVNVGGEDDLFRAKVVTKVIDDEGVVIKRLATIAGQCRL